MATTRFEGAPGWSELGRDGARSVRSIALVLVAAVLFGTTGTTQTFAPEAATPLGVGAVRTAIGGTLMALVGLAGYHRRRARRRIGPAAPVGAPPTQPTAPQNTPPTSRTTSPSVTRPGPDPTPRDSGLPRPGLGVLPPPRFPIPTWLALGLAAAGMAAYQLTFFAGTRANGVAIGTIVTLGSAPLAAGLLEWLVRRRRPGRAWLIATALAVVGVVLLSGGSGTVNLGGLAQSATAGVSYALELVLMKIVLDRGWTSSDAVSWVMGLAAVLAVPILLAADVSWVATPRGATVALWLAVATVVVAYQLLAHGLGGLPAATVSTLTLAEPATATLLGLVVVGERLTLAGVGGIVAIAGGLIVLARTARRG